MRSFHNKIVLINSSFIFKSSNVTMRLSVIHVQGKFNCINDLANVKEYCIIKTMQENISVKRKEASNNTNSKLNSGRTILSEFYAEMVLTKKQTR